MKIINDPGTQFGVDKSTHQGLLADILSRPIFAHLSTFHEEGPRESPVWFLWENEKIWMIGNYKTDSFPKRIERVRSGSWILTLKQDLSIMLAFVEKRPLYPKMLSG
ncbi:pyridoxamine 5'-phosphate oxidase family protein [Salicibibacter cibi]|uniref:pyridoxamine 5'-phosphate oxidase family protein n=1 Tax=Salicibibacter cibi TaxID=2743001 RepID=UPI001FECECE9|nr:pyridoxamine 5'-phosphate oxidase family protein [Salicibibacter cibi]